MSLTRMGRRNRSGVAPAEPRIAVVRVARLATGGDGVGPQIEGPSETQGRTTFVAGTAPGETVRVRLVDERARVAWGHLLDVLEPSPARVEPRCALAGRCGGCAWQHVTDEQQAAAKRDIVSRALSGGFGEGAVTIERPSDGFGYRDRAKLVVARGGPGARPLIGFRGRGTHEVIDVPACPLLGPELAQALPAVRTWAAAFPDGSEIAVQAGAGRVLARAHGDIFELTNGAWQRREPGDVRAMVDVGGDPARPLRIAPGGFAQVGNAGNRALVAAVQDAVGARPGRVLELYAGAGNFTRYLVDRAAEVLACDGDAEAVRAGQRNVERARWTTHGELLRNVRAGRMQPGEWDVAVVDPPRAGLDEATRELVARVRARVVYVSCDPQTLGRDVRALAAAGWRLVVARALDLMPQTAHVEVVATLIRADGPPQGDVSVYRSRPV